MNTETINFGNEKRLTFDSLRPANTAVTNKFNETSRKVGADVFISGGEAVQIPL